MKKSPTKNIALIANILLASLILFPNLSHAQIKVHKQLSTSDGLISNSILSMLQDSKGYLWIGTNNGLSRWDGETFKNYTTQDGLSAPYILDIEEGKDGKLYFSTYGGGVAYLEKDSIYNITVNNGLPNNWITKIFPRKNGELLLVGQYNVAKLYNGKVETILNLKGKYPGSIWVAHESKDSKLYLGTHNGLKIYDKDSIHVFKTNHGLANDTIWSLAEDENGVIYVGTNNGISKFVDGNISTLKFNNKKISAIVPTIYTATDNSIYFGTSEGVYVSKQDKIEHLNIENGLIQNDIWSITEDNHGTIYFGSKDYGINIYYPNRFEEIILNNSPEKENVLSIFQSKNGQYFFGTSNGLYLSESDNYFELFKQHEIKDELVKIIKETNQQKMLLGFEFSFGIFDDNRLQEYSLDFEPKGFNRIYSMLETFTEGILISTESGLFKFVDEEFHRMTALNGRIPALVNSMSILKDSTILLGTHGDGIVFFKNGMVESINEENGLSNLVINSLYVKDDDVILAGTDQGGLNIIKNKKVIDTLNTKKGLLSNTILGISEDNLENLYILTPRGVNIVKSYAGEPFITSMTKKDGLVSNNLNLQSVYNDDEGNVWFGTTEGVTKYNPNFNQPYSTPPKIFISKIEILNSKYSLQKLIEENELSYSQNYIRFFYSGIDIPNTDKIIYRYRLNGVDLDWNETNEKNIQYTSLDDGDYTFEVKARNEWGYWSEPVSLAFTINPAWWETWWFYTLTFLAIGSFIAFGATYRYRQLLEVEKIRTKISADLHDSIGSGLSEITILSGLLQANQNVEDLQSGLKNISVTARSLVGNMSDIVWLVNPSKDSLKDLLLRLQDSYQEVFAQANISFSISGIENIDEIHLPLTYRQHLFLMFKEAINNSLKYSNCSKMELKIETKGKNLTIEFSDDGKGFEMNEKSNGNGLRNMRSRAESIGGKTEIVSEIDSGTKIKFIGKIN